MYKLFLPVVLAVVFVCMAVSCDKDPVFKKGQYIYSSSEGMVSNCTSIIDSSNNGLLIFTVNGVTFKMIYVKGGTFQMGATSEQGSEADSDEKPAHSVTLSDYYMGEMEVTVALFSKFISETGYRTDAEKEGWACRWMQVDGMWQWNVVNGINWKYDAKGYVRNSSEYSHPVLYVSWNDANEFCKWLCQKTGKTFHLPTEAEWEYAARGGGKSVGYKYSGSDNINDVALYADNSGGNTHAVGTKQPNELGLYDMSGNVWEWCSDWYGSYGSGAQTNPEGPSSGSLRVLRGGSWNNYARHCRVSIRYGFNQGDRYDRLGFRLSMSSSSNNGTSIIDSSNNGTSIIDSSNNGLLIFKMKGVTFKMIYVKGGTFQMGGTSEQGGDEESDEKPVHSVTLSDYYIGETEVTQALWKEVTGLDPSRFKGDDLPVELVSYDIIVNEFLPNLNRLIGKTFRLPTEAEWEYAARGGSKSKGYKYSGSSSIDVVAWYNNTSGGKTHPVGTKQPNELGLYDMSGNVWEWCSDWHGGYDSVAQTDPEGSASGFYRVLRGGSWIGNAVDCRVSNRGGVNPEASSNYYGFRLLMVP